VLRRAKIARLRDGSLKMRNKIASEAVGRKNNENERVSGGLTNHWDYSYGAEKA